MGPLQLMVFFPEIGMQCTLVSQLFMFGPNLFAFALSDSEQVQPVFRCLLVGLRLMHWNR